ncbi:Ref family recombination enhancement nuclease [Stenotrophomonas sp.]|uniref:Ref family recombination enhancement nuclease n=1 Tax=Stenotrophomonas sp. TaxID=69392 RepID=UPI0028B1E402|nr:Ref family recombination enhancement nuclease [Stenotrophomonas sp.]
MKRGRRTSTPTASEAARIVACKEGLCVACVIRSEQPSAPWHFTVFPGCDYHHLLSGGRRIGHMSGIGLCGWHHRGIVGFGCTHQEMRDHYGPSLAEGSKPFHAAFGSDSELIARQDQMLGIGVAA